MHVDRSRFLLLTASLAAAACNQAQTAASPDTGGADPASGANRTGALGGASEPTASGPHVWLEIEPGTEDPARAAASGDCNNSVGRAVSCSLSAPGSHCESFDSTLALCRAFPEFMQPRAAEAAVDCMQAASGTQAICDWQLWQQCTAAGLQATCVDPNMRPECETIGSTCGGSLDLFACQQALSAVRPRHLQRVASCVQEFCEVSFCVSDLWTF